MDKRLVNKIVKNYLAYLIKNDFKIKAAYLFGSYVKGNFHEYSDIDLAIVLNNIQDKIETQIKLMNLRRDNYENMIEPHPFEENDFNYSNPVTYEILHTGKKLM